MKIILSGEPRSGKSTLVSKILSGVERKQGFVTREVLQQGERVGFDVMTATGVQVPLARVGDKGSCVVGKYSVNVEAFESVLPTLFSFRSDDLLYIDEIARMELQSPEFKKLVHEYLLAGNNFLGTMATNYTDDVTEKIMSRSDVIHYYITSENRAQVEELILRDLVLPVNDSVHI